MVCFLGGGRSSVSTHDIAILADTFLDLESAANAIPLISQDYLSLRSMQTRRGQQ